MLASELQNYEMDAMVSRHDFRFSFAARSHTGGLAAGHTVP